VRAIFISQTHGENSLRLREYRGYLLVIVRYSPLFTLLRRERGEEGGGGDGGKVRRAEATGCNRDNRGEGLMARGSMSDVYVRKESGTNAKAKSDIIKIIERKRGKEGEKKGTRNAVPEVVIPIARGGRRAPPLHLRGFIFAAVYIYPNVRARARMHCIV